MISVVVPVYNSSETIERCLRNLLIPRNAGIEVIVVDDRSSDDVSRVRAASHDMARSSGVRLEWITLETRGGPGKARNVGIEKSTGDWICFVDADDMVAPSHIEMLRRYCVSDIDFVRTTYLSTLGQHVYTVPMNAKTVETTVDPRNFIVPYDQKTMVDYCYCWAGIYKASFLKQNDIRFQNLFHAEDRLFTWKLHLYGRRMILAPIASYVYIRGERPSVTEMIGPEVLDVVGSFRDIYQELLKFDNFEYKNKLLRQAFGIFDNQMRRLSKEPSVSEEFRRRVQCFLNECDRSVLRATVNTISKERLGKYQVIGGMLSR